MSPAEIGAEATGVDPAQVMSVEILRDGLTNDSWLVRTTSDAVVVRMSNPQAQALQVDRRAEARILEIVRQAGIGPEVLLCDIKRHLLVTRYLGATCSAADLHDRARIARLGALLLRLHSLPVPADVERIDWSTVLAGYMTTLATLGRTAALDPDARARAQALALELESTSTTRCLCHNDVHYLNLIDADGLRLLDWEYAGIGDPYFDLASVAFYNDFDVEERGTLLRAYRGDFDAKELERLAKACIVFEYVHDLWHAVRTAVSDELL
jgi:thiamine kinase